MSSKAYIFDTHIDAKDSCSYNNVKQPYCGVEQSGSSSGSLDTKLKADVAESAVITELLRKGFRVLKPVGDRLPYDLALDCAGKLLRIQVKSA